MAQEAHLRVFPEQFSVQPLFNDLRAHHLKDEAVDSYRMKRWEWDHGRSWMTELKIFLVKMRLSNLHLVVRRDSSVKIVVEGQIRSRV
jgi:hypothetical protein